MDYHDMLAKLGIGSAHPGGISSTLEWIKCVHFSKDSKVLDVGCGTGRTACLIQKLYGSQVVGIDIRQKMIQKAILRAKNDNVDVKFLTASAEHLPFRENEFDYCLTESVNVFIHMDQGLKEYIRVLKPFGTYVDIEMATFGPTTEAWRASVQSVYGAKYVPDINGWKRKYRNTGFTEINTILTRPVRPDAGFDDNDQYLETVQLADPGAYQDRNVVSIMGKNSLWLESHHRSLLYGIFICRKPIASEKIEYNRC